MMLLWKLLYLLLDFFCGLCTLRDKVGTRAGVPPQNGTGEEVDIKWTGKPGSQ